MTALKEQELFDEINILPNKLAMIEASKDKLYINDMKSIENEFQYSDFENIK